MWDFLRHIYDSEKGGLGLLIAFVVLCESVVRVFQVVVQRKKGKP